MNLNLEKVRLAAKEQAENLKSHMGTYAAENLEWCQTLEQYQHLSRYINKECKPQFKIVQKFSNLLGDENLDTSQLVELFNSMKGVELEQKYFIAKCLYSIELLEEREAEKIKEEASIKAVESVLEQQIRIFGKDHPEDYLQEMAKRALGLMKIKPPQKQKLLNLSEETWEKRSSWGHHSGRLGSFIDWFVNPIEKF